MEPKKQLDLGALRFEQLPTPLFHLSPEALRAIAEANDILAALARLRAKDQDEHERIWKRPPPLYSKARERQRKALARVERNREIMRLAARGWPNAMIAMRMRLKYDWAKCHPVTISKIIQRTLKGNG